jgi:hypothetical protein
MALSREDLIDIGMLIKDAVAIISSTTPGGAAARTAYAVLKRTPKGRAIIDELERRGLDAFGVVQAIHAEFAAEDPLDTLVSDLRGTQVAAMPFRPRPLTRLPSNFDIAIPKKLKRKPNKFAKAVKAGMKAAKDSTSYGGKGVINNAKKAFTSVTKTASKINKGAKVAKKGVLRKIGLAVKKVLK